MHLLISMYNNIEAIKMPVGNSTRDFLGPIARYDRSVADKNMQLASYSS